jgi:cysteine synthase A
VIEATSGNTGIGLAMVCAQKGYPLVVTMAETFSVERRKLMRFLGAKVVLTPAARARHGHGDKAVELAKTHGWFLTRQFENEANPTCTRAPRRGDLRDFAATARLLGDGIRHRRHAEGRGARARQGAAETKIVVCEPADAPAARQRRAAAAQPDGSRRPPIRLQAAPDAGLDPDFIPKLTGDAVDTR